MLALNVSQTAGDGKLGSPGRFLQDKPAALGVSCTASRRAGRNSLDWRDGIAKKLLGRWVEVDLEG